MKEFNIVGIIPSLNPDLKLIEVVHGMLEEGFSDIIIVNDGSKEECLHIFHDIEKIDGCVVLNHECNKGKGAALKTAFSYYLNHYDLDTYYGVVTADADGQHLPKDIYKTALHILNTAQNDCVLSLGTRDFDADDVPFKSKKGNKITTVVFKLLHGKLINDTQTGLRGISNAFVRECVTLKGERFEYEINMLIQAARKNYTIIEQIIETVYFDSNRETHFNPVLDSIKIYKVMFRSFFRFACSGMISFVIDQALFACLMLTCTFIPSNVYLIPFATLIARICSSFINFSLNRKVVFDAGKMNKQNVIRYYMLCAMQLIASAFFVTVLSVITKGNASIFKCIVDALLFLISYKVQKEWVFKIH